MTIIILTKAQAKSPCTTVNHEANSAKLPACHHKLPGVNDTMHYIRFLKPPQISSGTITGKITITNDLGDDFLTRELPLSISLTNTSCSPLALHPGYTKPITSWQHTLTWKAHTRELPFAFHLPKVGVRVGEESKESGRWRLAVLPLYEEEPGSVDILSLLRYSLIVARGRHWRSNAGDSSDNEEEDDDGDADDKITAHSIPGQVLPAYSATFLPNLPNQILPAVVYRKWKLHDHSEIVIEEETGNSIARHVWDAGVLFSALLEDLYSHPYSEGEVGTPYPFLRELNYLVCGEKAKGKGEGGRGLNILELGTGCAIVSAVVSRLLPNARVTGTDMPEATAIAISNLERNEALYRDRIANIFQGSERGKEKLAESMEARYEVLDWTEPLPPSATEIDVDLVLVADCTYNSDVVPALVATLSSLVQINPQVLIAVALKWRHDSEAVFHMLMAEKGMVQVDKHTERKGNYDVDATGKEEEVEVYLFAGPERKIGVVKGEKKNWGGSGELFGPKSQNAEGEGGVRTVGE